jgi:hypothetical protein
MKKMFNGIMSAIMFAYTIYRVLTTIIFLPFTESIFSRDGLYFGLLVVIAAASTALGFTNRRRLSGFLAIAVGLLSLAWWLSLDIGMSFRIWPDFYWFVIPELCFASAGLAKWLTAAQSTPSEELQSNLSRMVDTKQRLT